MASTITPTWSDNVTVLAIGAINRNTVSRTAPIDLRTKWGAMLFVRIGRGGTTALTTGVAVIARRTINNNGIEHVGGAAASFLGQTAAAIGTTCAAAGNNAGVTSLVVASSASFAVGDLIWVASAAPANTDSEWCRVSQITDATHLLLDAPTKFAHNNVAHTVRNKSDLYTIWLEGGATYELIIDYGTSTTGEAITAEVWAQTLDSIAAT